MSIQYPAGQHNVGTQMAVGSWAATLRSVRRLTLHTSSHCQLQQLLFSLEGLSQLRSLKLSARQLQFGPAVALPPSLTRLVVECFTADPAPVVNLQVGGFCIMILRSTHWQGGGACKHACSCPPSRRLPSAHSMHAHMHTHAYSQRSHQHLHL